MVDRLTNGDITKDEEVYQMNYIQCLNRLAWWKVKDDYIEEMNKRNRNKK